MMADLTLPSSCADIELQDQEMGDKVAGQQDVQSSALKAAQQGHDQTLGDILRTNKEAFRAVDGDTGDSLLHVIARSQAKGSVECLRILLDDYKVDTEERNLKDETPLHVAALSQ